jgi:hypothetical protein
MIRICNANHGLNEPGADARRSIFSLTAPRQTENSRSEVLSPPQRTMQGPRSVADPRSSEAILLIVSGERPVRQF